MRARKRHLIGRRIVAVDWRKFPKETPGDECCRGFSTDPVLTLDNGRRVWFVTDETGGPEYGVTICCTEKTSRTAGRKG